MYRAPFSAAEPVPTALPATPLHASGRRVPWPLVILLLSLALTGVAAFDSQRAASNQRKIAVRAMREYASFAAWSYAQHLGAVLDGIGREVLGAVNHGDAMHMSPEIPPASNLAEYLPLGRACNCRRTLVGPSPDAFFALDLRSRTVNEDFNAPANDALPPDVYVSTSEPPAGATTGARVASNEFHRWIVDSLAARVRSRAGLNRGFRFVLDGNEATRRYVGYTLMPTVWGDTIVYGAVYSPAAFDKILSTALDSPGLLPDAFSEGRRNRDVINVAVADRARNRLFSTPTLPYAGIVASIATPFASDSLIIDAAIRPQIAGSLLIGGAPASGIPFPLGLLALAAALSVIAVVQIRREGELARLRTGFVSSVSHELRTPVAQIRLYLETLRLGRARTPAQRDWALGHIERETRRLAYLVENVLRFSTLEQAQPSVATDSVDVAAAVGEIVAEFEPLARSRGAAIEFHAAAVPLVSVRKDALRHILVNLLDNAVKYGPPEQAIHVSVLAGADGQVVLAVQDEGPGIAHRERESIWRPFARGTTGAATGGSGIGLTIVRELARAHGGTAYVDPHADHGSRFVVALPAARQTVS